MVECILTNRQFKPWRKEPNARRIELNIVANSKYMGDIKCYIQTTKEKGRATYNSLPYIQFGIPVIMIIEMIWSNV